MPRILGLDIGDKYIGIAVSDPLGFTAQPVQTYRKGSYEDDRAFFDKLVKDLEIEFIVAGLPVREDGEESKQSAKIRNYAGFLKNYLKLPLIFMDERLTTQTSDDLLSEAGVKKKDRKKVIDTLAAQLILQDYLEDQRLKRERNQHGR